MKTLHIDAGYRVECNSLSFDDSVAEYYLITGKAAGNNCFYADRYSYNELGEERLVRENVNLTATDIKHIVHLSTGKAYDNLVYDGEETEE